ncbi:MAG: hypothetical protein K2R98_08760 [Gemmataceae bacterium]|nr:hypothetical protein [Gemmataceae bacterium]
MRRIAGWKFKVALLVGMSAAASAWADPVDEEREPLPPSATGWRVAPWLQRKYPPSPPPKPAAKKPTQKPAKDKPDASATATPKPTSAVDQASVEREREEKAFLRRLAVCDSLSKVAQETRDDELERKAQQLHERAWALYQQRIAHLPCSGAQFSTDEDLMQKYLSAGGRATGSTLQTAPGSGSGGRAALQEVRP